MEISESKEIKETERPKYGIAIHGTSSHRAEQIAERGFDPNLGNNDKKQSFYYQLHCAHPQLENYLQGAWEKAMLATLKDKEKGIISEPVLIVFEAPPARIRTWLNGSSPTEGSYKKVTLPKIIDIRQLPDFNFKGNADPNKARHDYLVSLQQELLSMML